MSGSVRRRLFDEQDRAMEVDTPLAESPILSNSFVQDRREREQRFAKALFSLNQQMERSLSSSWDELPTDIQDSLQDLELGPPR
jgi:hypothetical protein